MKRIACIVIALLLCLSAVATAESVPSRTTTDLTRFEVTAENLPEDAGFVLMPVNEQTVGEQLEDYQERLDICQIEIEKLAASESVEAYFGEVTDAEGNPVVLSEMLASEQLNVFEFFPLIAESFVEEYGMVTATMLLSTPYEEGEVVAVLIGLVTLNEDETQSVAWQVFEGVGLAPEEGQEETVGRIQVELPPETVTAIQEGIVLMAVVSAGAAE